MGRLKNAINRANEASAIAAGIPIKKKKLGTKQDTRLAVLKNWKLPRRRALPPRGGQNNAHQCKYRGTLRFLF